MRLDRFPFVLLAAGLAFWPLVAAWLMIGFTGVAALLIALEIGAHMLRARIRTRAAGPGRP